MSWNVPRCTDEYPSISCTRTYNGYKSCVFILILIIKKNRFPCNSKCYIFFSFSHSHVFQAIHHEILYGIQFKCYAYALLQKELIYLHVWLTWDLCFSHANPHSSIPPLAAPFIHSLSVTPLSQACRGQKSRSNSLEVTKDDFEMRKKEWGWTSISDRFPRMEPCWVLLHKYWGISYI